MLSVRTWVGYMIEDKLNPAVEIKIATRLLLLLYPPYNQKRG